MNRLIRVYKMASSIPDYDGKGGWIEFLHRAHPDWAHYQPEPWELTPKGWRQGHNEDRDTAKYRLWGSRSCGKLGKLKVREAVLVVMMHTIDITPDEPLLMRDIRCAVRNELDFGNLTAIGNIRWKKTLCRECNMRPALGNSTWNSNVPCIYRRLLHFRCSEVVPGRGVSDPMQRVRAGLLLDLRRLRCDCTIGKSGTELKKLDAQGLYQWSTINGTIKDATMVPPRRLWDLKYSRVVPFHGRVSKLCRECFDSVSMLLFNLITRHQCIQWDYLLVRV